jgi:DNA-directed RNA polymerase specialized sigma24 family protein
MNSDGSVTQWISRLKGGEASAAGQLWQAYFPRLVGLARHKLGPRPRRLADEEDVALSAFKSLCLGAAGGRFPQLADRDSLWPLLVVLTAHKAHDLIKYEQRQKRGGGSPPAVAEGEGIQAALSREPTPEFAAMVAENCAVLLERLEPAPRQIAQWKLDGYTNGEIAQRLGCGLRTVERRLELIRRVWEQASGT